MAHTLQLLRTTSMACFGCAHWLRCRSCPPTRVEQHQGEGLVAGGVHNQRERLMPLGAQRAALMGGKKGQAGESQTASPYWPVGQLSTSEAVPMRPGSHSTVALKPNQAQPCLDGGSEPAALSHPQPARAVNRTQFAVSRAGRHFFLAFRGAFLPANHLELTEQTGPRGLQTSPCAAR